MSENQIIILGGTVFAVPPLPHRINRKAYPLCQKLHNGGFADRWRDAAKQGTSLSQFEVSDEEADQLSEFAFLIASAAEAALVKQGLKDAADVMTRAEFDDLPINPVELYNALMVGRGQTGVWVPIDSTEASDSPGEAQATDEPPT